MVDALRPFRHPAFFYRGDTEFLAGVIPYLCEGLDRGEPAAVAVPGPNLRLIEKALAGRADAVRLIDMERAGRNPGAILPSVLHAFAGAHPGPVRIVAEPIWAGRSGSEYPACVVHEALVNHAFAGRDLAVLCPYDVGELPPPVLADAERTHPELWGLAGPFRSARFNPDGVLADFTRPLEPPPGAVERGFDLGQLASLRGFAEIWAARHGLRRPRRDDFALAIAELTTNSVLYGGGTGVLRLWAEPAQVIGEVTDTGTITEPLAGRIPPPATTLGGRGLLLVNRLADLVRTYWIPGRTITRIHFTR
ncbi:sensor histidine kinase [Amycolatopsis vancoresmycina]|uniref:Anti-sigma regulatory factor n=1 Tax=Amycolatopsis vancoresmycina DSM 44592 TaxID=1292037 RepID=R1H1G5_9PSEU|nr:sensor histidine kinase [Amycolatopsis vancoresmycina]EOD57470.1 anti-sigma regulatory factor [Amycolatopsis vancoresmycina DSM 44592]